MKSPTPCLRRLAPTDAKTLRAFFLDLNEETTFLLFGPGQYLIQEEELRRHIEKCLASGETLEFVAELNGRIIGHVTLRKGGRPRNSHCADLGLIVTKDYWRQGLGAALLEMVLRQAKSQGEIRKINLSVRVDNERAIRLYKRFGFVKEGLRTRDCHAQGKFHDCLLMGLQLDPESA